MTEPILSVEGLDLDIVDGARRQPILRDVNLALGRGKILGLVGESGGGKTMVGKAVLGVLPDSARVRRGRILFEGRDLLSLSAAERRGLMGRAIAMILQNPMTALNPVLRIEAQLTDTLRLHLGLSKEAARERALRMLEAVHIREPARVLRQYPHELSGGMCQRIVIAIAFSCEPRLIIADEPTTALDVTVQHQVLRLIRELQERTGTSVLFVTHDLGVVAKVCDDVSVIYAGRILESAPAASLFAHPAHPYTRALLEAAPRYDRPEQPLAPVPEAMRAAMQAESAAYDDRRAAEDARQAPAGRKETHAA